MKMSRISNIYNLTLINLNKLINTFFCLKNTTSIGYVPTLIEIKIWVGNGFLKLNTRI